MKEIDCEKMMQCWNGCLTPPVFSNSGLVNLGTADLIGVASDATLGVLTCRRPLLHKVLFGRLLTFGATVGS